VQNRSAFEAARIATMLEKMEKREDDDAEPPLKLSMHLLGCFLIGLFVGLF
jgi:F0F1-type ATP synthase assembly protein I